MLQVGTRPPGPWTELCSACSNRCDEVGTKHSQVTTEALAPSMLSQIAQSENKELFDNALEKRVKGWFRTNSRKNDPVPAWRRTHELNPVGLWDLGRKFFNYWWSTKTRKQMILLANRRKISSSLTLCHNAYVIHLISSRHVNILSPIITRRRCHLLEDNSILFITTSLFMFERCCFLSILPEPEEKFLFKEQS
ncbi:forkhead box protein J3 isoform X6 [Prionailurus iriomotensis]